MLKGKKINSLDCANCPLLTDLEPLRGMPLFRLSLSGCTQITDLKPLTGMQLRILWISGCVKITDLSPLQGMNLTDLYFTPKYVTRGMETLRPMKALGVIGVGANSGDYLQPAEFWRRHDSGQFR